jgi:hypothetical protein
LVTCKADATKWAVKIIEKSKIEPGDHSLQTEIDVLCRVNQENCVVGLSKRESSSPSA